MGEIREKIRLTNAVDEALARRGTLPADQVRRLEVTAVVDTGAVMSVIPIHVAERLGLQMRGHRVARYADGRTESAAVTEPIVFECQNRDTLEEAMVLGDEVLIGQTVLEKLDLLADCIGQRLVPHPERPNQPVIMIR
jgi:predicted aspartyl protease